MNRLFWDFWLDMMMTKKILISDIIEIFAFFFFWLLYCIWNKQYLYHV